MTTRRRLLAATAIGLLAQWTVARAADSEPIHPFMLEDVNGVLVTDETLQGKFSLVFFGYTSCPDVCPTTLVTIAQTLKLLGPEADRVLPLFITLDPDRDTAKVLSGYTASFDPRIVGLRGPAKFVAAAAQAFGVTYKLVTPDPAKPEDYSVDHTASIFFVGPDARIIKRFGQGLAASSLASDMRLAMASVPVPN